MNWLLEMTVKLIEYCVFHENFRIESHTLVQGVHDSQPLLSTAIFGFEWGSVHMICIRCSGEFMSYVKIGSEKAYFFIFEP
jgi:hypothetical protein